MLEQERQVRFHNLMGNIKLYRYDATGKKHKESWFAKMRNTMLKKAVFVDCKICATSFRISKYRKSTALYCSRKCQSDSFRTSNETKLLKRRRSQLTAENKRRAKKQGVLINDFTDVEWQYIKTLYSNMCLCCKQIEPQIKLTIDHIIPISKGGNHTASNIQPLCLSCNVRKHVKTLDFRPPSMTLFTQRAGSRKT